MKILLAEDDVALADGLFHCLRDAGHDVALARDGAAALRELAAATPDLLVLDHGLPRVHGSQVLRQVRAAPRQPLVLLCSALDDAPQRLAEQGLAADDFLAKPFGLSEFESCVARLLQRGRTA